MTFDLTLLTNVAFVVIGLIALLWSADKFIDGAAATASHFGMSPLMVGMVIVGFGTSAPEMIIAAFAALDDSPGIVLGNAYGSNIANIGLVLGITAMLYPLTIGKQIIRREMPILIIALLACFGLILDGQLGRIAAASMLVVIIGLVLFNALYNKKDESANEEATEQKLSHAIFWLIVGLVLLLVSSKYLVAGAVGIATAFGVSELVIGLTVIAVGTSLPELASSIAAAKKGESDIVLGNIIGSCLFNALAVVGISGVIKPMDVSTEFLSRDFSTGFILTLVLWLCMFGKKQPSLIGCTKGTLLLACYIGYTIYLLMTL